jgi:hypothetical protein
MGSLHRRSRSRSLARRERAEVSTAAVGMLLAWCDDLAAIDSAAAAGARDLHQHRPNPARYRTRRHNGRPPGAALVRRWIARFAASEHADAAKAHPDLRLLTEPDEAGLHGAVTAAPATVRPIGGFEEVDPQKASRKRHSALTRGFTERNGALGGTRTPNLLIRSQMLSPIELRALVAEMRAYRGPGTAPNRVDAG